MIVLKKCVYNTKVITENEVLVDKAVIFSDKIEAIIPELDINKYEIDEFINANGQYLSPGFINIHTHGCCGYDAMDSEAEGLNKMSLGMASTGVTSFLPTTMTMSKDKILRALKSIREAMGKTEGAQIIGCHLEGPFISKKFKGAQEEEYIIEPDFEMIDGNKDIIKIITMAPENRGTKEFIEKCVKNNIIVSIGHTNASFDEAMEAINVGAKLTTHTFNAMTPLNHRNPGVVGAAMVSDIFSELIADNIHVHPAVQKIIYKQKGKERIILITDSMRACLLGEGEYDLGGQNVFVKNGEARLASGTIAGSIVTMDRAINNFKTNAEINIVDAVRLASLNPAKLISVDNEKGSIKEGKDADIVIFDENLYIQKTFVKGKNISFR
jgi:N-acetylglucosamine-6-phosphate deacetylase